MKTITTYNRKDGKTLKVKQNTKGHYIAEVYEDPQAKKWYYRATFESKDNKRNWLDVHTQILSFVLTGTKYRNK